MTGKKDREKGFCAHRDNRLLKLVFISISDSPSSLPPSGNTTDVFFGAYHSAFVPSQGPVRKFMHDIAIRRVQLPDAS